MESKKVRIEQLKKEKNAVILAHYYVEDPVQEVADYVGDSYYLSEIATKVEAETIVLCGVSFMGESAKILSPGKTVLLPSAEADCPMAHMATVEKIKEVRREVSDVAVVCYVNSTAELKAHADVCVTSSNALDIVRALPNQQIYFIPDEHLGRHIAKALPEKQFIFNQGYCHVHSEITPEQVLAQKAAHPQAEVLVHPECPAAVTALADYAGSTSGIIDYATKSPREEFIICTEIGVFYELQKRNPHKKFYQTTAKQICADMKKINLENIIHVLETGENTVELPEEAREKAHSALAKMLELAKRK